MHLGRVYTSRHCSSGINNSSSSSSSSSSSGSGICNSSCRDILSGYTLPAPRWVPRWLRWWPPCRLLRRCSLQWLILFTTQHHTPNETAKLRQSTAKVLDNRHTCTIAWVDL